MGQEEEGVFHTATSQILIGRGIPRISDGTLLTAGRSRMNDLRETHM